MLDGLQTASSTRAGRDLTWLGGVFAFSVLVVEGPCCKRTAQLTAAGLDAGQL